MNKDHVDRFERYQRLRYRGFRLSGCALLLFSVWAMFALLPGCAPEPPCDTCLKVKVSGLPTTSTENHVLLLTLTATKDPLMEIEAKDLTITAPGNDPTYFMPATTGENGVTSFSQYELKIPDLPTYYSVFAISAAPNDIGGGTLNASAVQWKINLGDVWLKKLGEDSGLVVWINASNIQSLNTLYIRASIFNSKKVCLAHEVEAPLQVEDKEIVLNRWENSTCPANK